MFNSGKHFQVHGHAIHHVDGISITVNLNNTPRCVHDPPHYGEDEDDSHTDVDGQAEDMSSTKHVPIDSTPINPLSNISTSTSTSNAHGRDQGHRYRTRLIVAHQTSALDPGHIHKVAHRHHHHHNSQTKTKTKCSIYPTNPHSHLKVPPSPPSPRHPADPILAAILRDLQTGRLTGDVIGHIHGVGSWCVCVSLPLRDDPDVE
ncbi:hypothetical protein VNI00_004924 [Paramarasmius palmivorus]|uniref:Uncharacterized protein n=1 Tax=Paramarasmius palmivorus TaxID=297713 RepID=A0AAW0DE57_9AGAR